LKVNASCGIFGRGSLRRNAPQKDSKGKNGGMHFVGKKMKVENE
jgi:hypothetical protein